MKIYSLSPINFTQLKMTNQGLLKTPSDFSCKNKSGDELDSFCTNINQTPEHQDKDSYQFYLNRGEINYGYTTFKKTENSLFCNYINSQLPLERNKGIGTILHLVNVIEMLENDLDSVTLTSLPEAVLFHGKFGFKADLKDKNQAKFVLLSIIPTAFINKDFSKISAKASKLNSQKFSKTYLKETNQIMDEFIDICLKQDKETLERVHFKNDPIGYKLMYPMILTKESVIANKDFYNSLLKKFDIDYQI